MNNINEDITETDLTSSDHAISSAAGDDGRFANEDTMKNAHLKDVYSEGGSSQSAGYTWNPATSILQERGGIDLIDPNHMDGLFDDDCTPKDNSTANEMTSLPAQCPPSTNETTVSSVLSPGNMRGAESYSQDCLSPLDMDEEDMRSDDDFIGEAIQEFLEDNVTDMKDVEECNDEDAISIDLDILATCKLDDFPSNPNTGKSMHQSLPDLIFSPSNELNHGVGSPLIVSLPDPGLSEQNPYEHQQQNLPNEIEYASRRLSVSSLPDQKFIQQKLQEQQQMFNNSMGQLSVEQNFGKHQQRNHPNEIKHASRRLSVSSLPDQRFIQQKLLEQQQMFNNSMGQLSVEQNFHDYQHQNHPNEVEHSSRRLSVSSLPNQRFIQQKIQEQQQMFNNSMGQLSVGQLSVGQLSVEQLSVEQNLHDYQHQNHPNEVEHSNRRLSVSSLPDQKFIQQKLQEQQQMFNNSMGQLSVVSLPDPGLCEQNAHEHQQQQNLPNQTTAHGGRRQSVTFPLNPQMFQNIQEQQEMSFQNEEQYYQQTEQINFTTAGNVADQQTPGPAALQQNFDLSSTATTPGTLVGNSINGGDPSSQNQNNMWESLTARMQQSQKSQQEIKDWDRKMGLRGSHSVTMTKSNLSRKKLEEAFLELNPPMGVIPTTLTKMKPKTKVKKKKAP